MSRSTSVVGATAISDLPDRSAPVFTPPLRLLSFGIPPTKSPPTWGAPPLLVDALVAELALARFGEEGTDNVGGAAAATTEEDALPRIDFSCSSQSYLF